jgi:hypothetical protein
MTHLKHILIALVLVICFSCKNETTDSNSSEDGISLNSKDTISISEQDKSSPKFGNHWSKDELNNRDDESGQNLDESATQSKEIEWSNGNTYYYHYTEQIEWKDSTGTRNVTVYIEDKPKDVYCYIVKCEWCGKEMTSQGYTFEEYPNLDALRGKENGLSNGFFSTIRLALSAATEKQYWDLKNNRIRTEWRINCDYGGPDGFCSLKCESEYNNNNR